MTRSASRRITGYNGYGYRVNDIGKGASTTLNEHDTAKKEAP